jgi:ParB family chromosome partitioning protein
VPAQVREVPDRSALALALIENIQRENLDPLEEAHGLQRLIDEFGLTHESAAKAVGRSRSAVSNLLRLIALPTAVQEYLHAGDLEMGHARALLALPAAEQARVAARVVEERLSVRETERLVHALANPRRPHARARGERDADTLRLENALAERLGAKVRIEPGRGGSGKVVIRYASLDELDGIVAKVGPVMA